MAIKKQYKVEIIRCIKESPIIVYAESEIEALAKAHVEASDTWPHDYRIETGRVEELYKGQI